ncbi:hypothetical protein H8959_000466, partial [Pygathrix nigripes]
MTSSLLGCPEQQIHSQLVIQEPYLKTNWLCFSAENGRRSKQGERTTWITPATLNDLLELKANFPKAPLVMGNTELGPSIKFKNEFHPVFISPLGLPELHFVNTTDDGVTIGAGYSLAQLNDALHFIVSEQPKEKTKTHRALLKHLRTLAGAQIRNMATLGGHVVSRPNFSDLNPILAAGNAAINLVSKEGQWQIPLNGPFLERSPEADLKSEEIVSSVYIPYSTQWHFVFGLRMAQRQENAFAIVNAGMSVKFEDGTNTIKELQMFYGSVGPTTVSASQTCKQLIGRQWDDQMLSDACRWVLDEIYIPPAAEGGMVEYRRTLIISLLFKFYLKVRRGLNQMDPQKFPDIPEKFMSALEDFPIETPQGIQMFQCVDPHQPPQDPVGHPVMHQSAIKHTTGEAVYIDDMPCIDQELFLAPITSTRAHAKIISIDISEALALPGVVDVITAENVPGDNNYQGEIFYAQNEVICVGQIVGTVAADTYAHAREAAKKVKITYGDIEPRIITIEQALEHNSFLFDEKKIEQGNVEQVFKYKSLKGSEVHVEGQEHFYMETLSILALSKEDKEMVLHLGTQYPTRVQEYVAAALNVPRNRIACRMERTGGGFGGKVAKPAVLGAVSAVAANKTGRPIRFILERGDDMLITAGRHPLLGKYKIGFMNNGVIKAADVKYYVNGRCTPDESEMVVEFIVLKSENAYYIPNFRCQGRACKTNPSNTAFRGFGFPQGTVVVEAYITAVASQCNLPPKEVKEINMYKRISKTAFKQTFNPEPLQRCWKECLEKSSFHARKLAAEEFNKKNYWKKRGLAIVPMKFSIGIPTAYYNQAAALVHIYLDGSVLVTHGGYELGQGLYTKMIQVASHELNIPQSYIHLSETSTVTVSNGVLTSGSMGTDINGKAVQNACHTLMARLHPIIRKNPKGKWEDWIAKAFEESISLSATGYFKGYQTNMDWEKGEGNAYPYYVYGAACSEVEVDYLTGAHKLLRTDIFMEAAFSINPALDIGQIEGAFIQGMRFYTIEELKYSPEGVLYSRSPDDYKIPTVTEIPEEFYVTLPTSGQIGGNFNFRFPEYSLFPGSRSRLLGKQDFLSEWSLSPLLHQTLAKGISKLAQHSTQSCHLESSCLPASSAPTREPDPSTLTPSSSLRGTPLPTGPLSHSIFASEEPGILTTTKAWGSLYLLPAFVSSLHQGPGHRSQTRPPGRKQKEKSVQKSIVVTGKHPIYAGKVNTHEKRQPPLTVFQVQLQRLWLFHFGLELDTNVLEPELERHTGHQRQWAFVAPPLTSADVGLGEAGMFLGSSVLFAIYDAVAAARRERGLAKTFVLSSLATPEMIRMMCVDQFTDM